MPDTHDERGGDEAAMLLAIRRRALTASTYAEWHQVGRDIETLAELLAAATARAEKAGAEATRLRAVINEDITAYETQLNAIHEARDYWQDQTVKATKERDEARELARASLDILRNVSDEPMRELFEVDDMDELPGWFTGYGKPGDTLAPDAAQDGRSATETDAEPFKASGVELEFGKGAAGLSEAERCYVRHVHDGLLHICSLPAGHGNHRCAEGDWWTTEDDTTEDGRHG